MSKKIVDEIKEVVKKRKKKAVETTATCPDYHARSLVKCMEEIDKTNKRIDRIIEAIDKSRPVRGL